jgi:hypothetical protein
LKQQTNWFGDHPSCIMFGLSLRWYSYWRRYLIADEQINIILNENKNNLV